MTSWTEEKKAYDREYRKKNREKIRAYKKAYYEKNRARILEWNDRWRKEKPEVFKESILRHKASKGELTFGEFVTRKFNSGRAGAKNRGLSWELTKEELHELLKNNTTCALSGRELKYQVGEFDQASLDRIDCSKGYTIDNVQIVSQAVNCCRWDLSIDDFRKLCEDVSKYNK